MSTDNTVYTKLKLTKMYGIQKYNHVKFWVTA